MPDLPPPLSFDYFRNAVWPWVQAAVLLALTIAWVIAP